VISAFREKAQQFSLPTAGSSKEIAAALHQAQAFYSEAMAVHLQSSTTSGVASNILQAMISGGQESTPAQQSEAANLMAGACEVESAVLVDQLVNIVDQIAVNENNASAFIALPTAEALAWLHNEGGKISEDFLKFMQRHGHRGYRELCMRELCWFDAPEGLVATLQASVKARLAGVKAITKPTPVDQKKLSRGLRWILPKAHNAIRRREATKSLLVDIANRFKRSYRALGQQLTTEGKLEDADQVFFFTHQELMAFIENKTESVINKKTDAALWQRKTNARRLALAYQDRLEFNEICVGKPVPVDARLLAVAQDGSIVGRPVSSGIVEGNARVAFSVAEAAALQPGEILVAPITDVGWTPYFSVISGLITDVGSSVSHGAVIAREYGLPAIVNTRIATKRIKTGDKIRLDANTGTVKILSEQ
jgi:pyruvate,water dikinase